MTAIRIVQIACDLLALPSVVYAVRQGYRRGRPRWSRLSWLRFGVVLGLGLAMLA